MTKILCELFELVGMIGFSAFAAALVYYIPTGKKYRVLKLGKLYFPQYAKYRFGPIKIWVGLRRSPYSSVMLEVRKDEAEGCYGLVPAQDIISVHKHQQGEKKYTYID